MDTHAHSDTGRYDEQAWSHVKKAGTQHASFCTLKALRPTHPTCAHPNSPRTLRARMASDTTRIDAHAAPNTTGHDSHERG